MCPFTDEELSIFYKLWRNRCFGKGHILIDNVVDGFPTNIQKQMGQSVNNLIRKGYLGRKPTKHGQAVYINLSYRNQIEKELKKKYSFL
jgi:hypothetical protein